MAEDNLAIITDYLQLVNNKQPEFSELFRRMDEDKLLSILQDYQMKDKDGREEPDVDNITINDSGTFRDRVISTLIKAQVLPEVEGKHVKDKEAAIIEEFIRDINQEADNIIQEQDYPGFKEWDIGIACDRGRVARRITIAEEDGKLTPTSFLPIDTRYLIYDNGIKGIKWAAYIVPRLAGDINDEYPDANATGKWEIITDFWDNEKETVFVGKRQVAENENVWGEVPFVIQVMPTGVWTMDEDRMLHSGESIYSRNRKLYAAKNLFATILQSGMVKSFFNGLQVEVENVNLAKKPANSPYRKKIVMPVEKGTKGYFNMPIQDLTNTALQFYGMLDSALQEGALPKVSYGSVQFPMSAVGMAELKEAEDPLYFPRIQGLTMFWQRCMRMMIRQYIKFGNGAEIGEEGFKTPYQTADLDKDYRIKFSVTMKSPKMDMVNISTAAAVGDMLSEDTKLRDYYHIENPTLEIQKKLSEKASRMSPALALYDSVKALHEIGETVKANILAEQLGVTLDQILMGQQGEVAPVPDKPATQLMPLFKGTGGVTAPSQGGGNAKV